MNDTYRPGSFALRDHLTAVAAGNENPLVVLLAVERYLIDHELHLPTVYGTDTLSQAFGCICDSASSAKRAAHSFAAEAREPIRRDFVTERDRRARAAH